MLNINTHKTTDVAIYYVCKIRHQNKQKLDNFGACTTEYNFANIILKNGSINYLLLVTRLYASFPQPAFYIIVNYRNYDVHKYHVDFGNTLSRIAKIHNKSTDHIKYTSDQTAKAIQVL